MASLTLPLVLDFATLIGSLYLHFDYTGEWTIDCFPVDYACPSNNHPFLLLHQQIRWRRSLVIKSSIPSSFHLQIRALHRALLDHHSQTSYPASGSRSILLESIRKRDKPPRTRELTTSHDRPTPLLHVKYKSSPLITCSLHDRQTRHGLDGGGSRLFGLECRNEMWHHCVAERLLLRMSSLYSYAVWSIRQRASSPTPPPRAWRHRRSSLCLGQVRSPLRRRGRDPWE